MINGIEHIAIFAKNSKNLCDWYVNMFNLKVVYDNNKGTYFVEFKNGSLIEICPCDQLKNDPSAKDQGLRHLAISVSEKGFDTMVDKLKSNNAPIVTDVTISPDGTVKTFFFKDIEGNISHLIYRAKPLY